MAVATDATLKSLVNSVGGIDITGLAKDSTLQSINTTLAQIKTAIDNINPVVTHTYLFDRKVSSQAVSVPDATHTVILQLSLTAGTWIINGNIISPNANGYRQVYLTDDISSVSAINSIISIMPAVSGTNTSIPYSGIIELNSNTNVYVKVRQNSGGNLNIYGILNAIKII